MQDEVGRRLIRAYADAGDKLVATSKKLNSRLGSKIPKELSAVLDSSTGLLTKLETAATMHLKHYKFSDQGKVQAQLLIDSLQSGSKQFVITKSPDKITFFQIEVIPSGLWSYKLQGDVIDTATHLRAIAVDIERAHATFIRCIMGELDGHEREEIQENIDAYFWAQRGLSRAFEAAPFRLTVEDVERALRIYYEEARKNINSNSRQKALGGEGNIVNPVSPVANVNGEESAIIKRTEICPTLDLRILNHRTLNPMMEGGSRTFLWVNMMEHKGANWARSSARSTPRDKVEAICLTTKSTLVADSLIDDGTKAVFQEGLEAGRRLKSIVETECIRIAVLGPTSHGKSTFLNTLIGQKLLYSDARATTSWPLIIRHNPSKEQIPTLYIRPGHFKPFFDLIAREKPSAQVKNITEMRQANPRDPRLPKNHSYITDLWNTWKEDPDFIQDVAKWEGGSYHFPENTSTSKEICKMGVRIGWLVRMWYLFEGHKTSEIVDENWPTLTVHMRELAEEMRDRPIEFVDLPGFGEKLIIGSDVTARWETVMEKSHAAILVFKADRGQIDSDETFKLLNKIRTKVFKDKKPFIAVGTHLDTHSLDPANPDWTNKDAESLFRPLWFDESAAIVPKRVVLVSNKLYASAPVVIKRIKENIWAYEKLAEGEGMAAMHSYMPPERAKKAWHKENPSDVTQSMDEYIKDSRFQIAASRIRLLSMSAFKGQIRAPLSELELKLNSLKSSYSCVLDVACQKAETLDYYKKKYDEFAQKTSEFCQIWWHRQSGFAFSEMKEIQKLAWAAKEEVIASFIAGVDVIIQESKFSVSSDVITIPDSESASAFITAIETKLRTILDSTQEYYLETARKQLELAWEERLNELGQYFDQSNDRGDGDAITPPGISTFLNYIRSGITAKLKGVSLSTSTIGDILSSLIDRRMAEMGTEVRAGDTGFLYARQLAETTYRKGEKGDARRRTAIVRYMTGFNIKALEDIGRLTETQPDEELPRETFRPHPASIRADTVNVVGVLIRPAVNATSNSSSTDLYSWDFLSTPPKEEIHVSKMLIIKTYTTEIIEQWHGIMENEWLDSSDGVIELCSSIGLSIVRDDFEKRRKVLTGKMEDQEKALLGLQTLILAQANCAALSSAVEQLVHECSTEDLDSVEILEEKSSTQQ